MIDCVLFFLVCQVETNMFYTKSNVFGPRLDAPRGGVLVQKGEGFASFFSNLFRRVVPFASKTLKKVASSNVVKQGSKQFIDSAANAAINVAADVISGDKNASESVQENVTSARKEIGKAIRDSKTLRKRKKNISKGTTKKKRKTKSKEFDIFDDDGTQG